MCSPQNRSPAGFRCGSRLAASRAIWARETRRSLQIRRRTASARGRGLSGSLRRVEGDLLEQALRRYQNRAIETAQVIEELIALAKDIRQASARGEALGYSVISADDKYISLEVVRTQ